ncbi:MAG TPA: OB-fold domain-containing protein [Oscillospiraceae bacterium]|nr:OB-fold domain-containing protein [Oscillospiraceae bacterium]
MYKDGAIFSFTVIYTPTEKFAPLAPYIIAIVDDGTSHYLVRIEEFDKTNLVRIGQAVVFSHLDADEKPVYKLA